MKKQIFNKKNENITEAIKAELNFIYIFFS